MKLRELIIKYRTDHDLSQRQFAEKCGISNGYISMIENDVNPKTGKPAVPSLKMLHNIAAGMNMTLDDLLTSIDELVVDIGLKKNAASAETAKSQEFIELFNLLSPEEKNLVIAQIRGILSSR